jgi:ribonuclease HI
MPKHGKQRQNSNQHHRHRNDSRPHCRPYVPMEKLDIQDMADLATVVQRLGIPDNWDILIYGDGSGNARDKPCGWGWVLVDRHNQRRKVEWGALGCGSIVTAELLPTIHAMLWQLEYPGRIRAADLGRPVRVHVITDSETTVAHWRLLIRGGRGAQKLRRRRPLWNSLDGFEGSGYVFEFHWTRRNQFALHILADWLSKQASADLAAFLQRQRDKRLPEVARAVHGCNASA